MTGSKREQAIELLQSLAQDLRFAVLEMKGGAEFLEPDQIKLYLNRWDNPQVQFDALIELILKYQKFINVEGDDDTARAAHR